MSDFNRSCLEKRFKTFWENHPNVDLFTMRRTKRFSVQLYVYFELEGSALNGHFLYNTYFSQLYWHILSLTSIINIYKQCVQVIPSTFYVWNESSSELSLFLLYIEYFNNHNLVHIISIIKYCYTINMCIPNLLNILVISAQHDFMVVCMKYHVFKSHIAMGFLCLCMLIYGCCRAK